MSSEQDRELLELAANMVQYDAASGSMHWKAKPTTHPDSARWNARYAGKKVGTLDDKGYIRIVVQMAGKKRKFRAHQLAWFIANGRPACGEIDHINQNKLDNRIENLREVTRAENQRNGTRKGNNTSGIPGVSWHTQRQKWCAQASLNGKHHHLGLFADKADAEAAARAFRLANGFTATHGCITRAAAALAKGEGKV